MITFCTFFSRAGFHYQREPDPDVDLLSTATSSAAVVLVVAGGFVVVVIVLLRMATVQFVGFFF